MDLYDHNCRGLSHRIREFYFVPEPYFSLLYYQYDNILFYDINSMMQHITVNLAFITVLSIHNLRFIYIIQFYNIKSQNVQYIYI